MTVTVEGLGPLIDLATAIGLISNGQLDTTWFSAPGDRVGAMLRSQEQREALLRAANELLQQGATPVDDEAGRRWVELFAEGAVSLNLVVSTVGSTTEVGIGARLTTTGPSSETSVYVPLLHVPASGPVTVAFVDGSGLVVVSSHITLDSAVPPPGELGLRGIRVTATVATDGSAPKLSAALMGLQLPGETTPYDAVLEGTPAELGESAIRLLLGIVQHSVHGAIGELAELLALVGITDDPAIPRLPVAELLAQGIPAWGQWLETLVTTPAALTAWLLHFKRLIGHGSLIEAAASPGLRNRIGWTLASGVSLGVVVRASRTAAGVPVVELGLDASLSAAGPPDCALELSATLARITLGATPSVVGLPLFEAAARLGPRVFASDDERLLNLAGPTVKVGSLRAGFALDEKRQLVFILGANDVTIGTHPPYPFLDLTNAHTLADVGGAVVGDIANAVFDRLGVAGTAVRVLIGLSAPASDPAWPAALLTPLPELLANPVRALVAYHTRVIASRRAGYAAVLDSLRSLLAPTTFVDPITGIGTETIPWQLPLAVGVGLAVWTTPTTLELGVSVEQSIADLGGGCPTADLRVVARIASIALNGSGGHAVPGALVQVKFGARGGARLRLGDATAAIVADNAGLELRWDRSTGLAASVLVPGLAAMIDGESVALALPTLAADGTLAGDVPWRALELLLGHVLHRLDLSWTDELTRLLGWIPSANDHVGGRIALESLVHDPIAALREWTAARIREGDVAEVVRRIAMAFAPGVYRGRGDASAPFAIPLSASAAARRVELNLWSDNTASRVRSVPSLADLGASTDRVAVAFRDAAARSQSIADALVDRDQLSSGLAALAARWTDTDGLVSAANAVLPGATVHEIAGVSHLDLPSVDLGALCAAGLEALTVVVVGAQDPAPWPGIAGDHEIDLLAAGLVPEAFDLSRMATDDGPWLVRLAGRADCIVAATDDGATLQVGRLARVIDALAARADVDQGVTIIGFGSAGHAAAAVASRPGVSRLITMGTPHGGIDLSVVETEPAATGLQLLSSVVPAANRDSADSPALARARGLLDALRAVYDGPPGAAADLAPPATSPIVPSTVDVHCVRGKHDRPAVLEAIGALAAHALAAEADDARASAAGVYGDVSEALNVGLSVVIDPPATAGALHLTFELSLIGSLLAPGGSSGIRVRIGIGRADGWLAGGPDPSRPNGVSRNPSLRRAEIEVELRLDGSATAQLVFHEASALGVARKRWVVNQDAINTLLPEARVLVGRLAAGLGTIPATGQLRDLAELLDVLGLVDTTTGVATGMPLGLSVDGIRRLVVDPRGLLVDATSAVNAGRVANALAKVLQATVPANAPTTILVQIDGITISLDLLARTMHASATSLAFASGVSLTGALSLATSGAISADVGLALGAGAGPNGRAVLDVSVGATKSIALRWEGAGSAFPAALTLYPTPDVRALSRMLTTLVPSYVLWAGMTFVRSLQPGAVALIDPLLRAVGLLSGAIGDERVEVPFVLVADPVHWLTHSTILGDATGAASVARIGGLLDAVAQMLGIPQPVGGGGWQMPYGIMLATRTDAARATLALSIDTPVADTPIRVATSIALALPSGALPASPVATLALALPGAGPISAAGRLSLSVGASGLTIRLIVPASNLDLQLVPGGVGLTDLGGASVAAATYALPYVLDAIARIPVGDPAHAIGVALTEVGDALGLRGGGHFDAAQIQLLASNPAVELARRLLNNLLSGIDALVSLLSPAIPAGYAVSRSGNDLLFRHTGALPFEIRVTVPVGAAGVRLTATVANVVPFAGAQLGASLTVDATGLVHGSASFGVDPASALVLGPVSLAPVVEVAIGNAPTGGARVAVGLALAAGRSVNAVLRFAPTPGFALEPSGGSLAELIAELVLPPAFDLALSTQAMTSLLNRPVLGGATIKELLDNVIFLGNNFDPNVFVLATLWARLVKLAANVAAHSPTILVDALTIGIAGRAAGADQIFGVKLSLAPGQRFRLVDSDVKLDLEVDASWVTAPLAEGLEIDLLRITGAIPAPYFGLSVAGLGLRLSKDGGPLLDTFITIDSLALHGLFAVDTTGVTGAGGQLELGGFAVGLGSAGGSNKVASGILKDSASGGQKPEPKFSPALSAQRYGTGALATAVRAGPGAGPWWITIQRGFGPVYIEQVGFGVTLSGESVIAARVIVDGHVSMLGLTVAVDELAVGTHWPPSFASGSWEVDLAGLAVAADVSGVQIAGGLRRNAGPMPDYLGMVSIRFSVYGISAYGGYAVIVDPQGQFTSLFLYGALSAPIGGVPAFFVTGLAAGVGVNRKLLLPPDLNDFPGYPLLQALDRSAPIADPDATLDALRAYFPASRGAFWFAAGLSFNSFSLIDGILVVAVAIGDGLDINILGLARAGLPNPSAPLIQIELALIARFSSKEGVLWIQAQLTDNSFLLTRDCRLTGGFAYVMWFKGDKAGQFVVTLGGYHPSFHRDGYPVVPRLGFVWSVSTFLVIKGESYFALTSEAIMIGTRFEASLTLGPLWAYLRLGADGIVYFDPFRFTVTAFAELGAGITIDIDLGWFGHVRITASVQLHADVLLEGPEFRGRATIDLDVTSASISFGDWVDRATAVLSWPEFEAKYVRPGGAAMMTAMPGRGTIPPSTASGGKAPTGGAADPFLVLPEFTFTVTTTAATNTVQAGGTRTPGFPIVLAVGPMHVASVTSTLTIRVRAPGGADQVGTLQPTTITGQFPLGAWGPQSQHEPKPVPTGDTVEAVNGATLTAVAAISVGTVPIEANQVEIGPRLQLPFLTERVARAQHASDVAAAEARVRAAPTAVGAVLNVAYAWRTTGPNGAALSPLARAMFAGERLAPPQLVPLTYRMAIAPTEAVRVPQGKPPKERKTIETRAHPPRLHTLLTSPGSMTKKAAHRTSVGAAARGAARVTPRTVAEVQTTLDSRLPALLVIAGPTAAVNEQTIVATSRRPMPARAGDSTELRRAAGQAPWRNARLDALSVAFVSDGAAFAAGDVAVFTAERGHYDIDDQRPSLVAEGDASLRVVAVDTAGNVTLDAHASNTPLELPQKTDRIAVVAGAVADSFGAAGWHSGMRLAQIGARTLLGPACSLVTSGVTTRRGGVGVATGFVVAADAVSGYSIVRTRFAARMKSVAIILEESTATDDLGEILELGISGASRAVDASGEPLPPRVVSSAGRTIHVFDVQPDESNAPVEVTVATAEHTHLAGVIAAGSNASIFAETLARRDLGALLGHLVDASSGSVRVRWVPQHTMEMR